MDGAIAKVTLAMIVPGVVSVFGVAFLCAWLVDRNRTYLLLLAIACAISALASVSQILGVPSADGPNALVSGLLYATATLLGAQGILLRSERALPLVFVVAVLPAFCFLLWYFSYVDRSLIARVYVMNFGVGMILLIATLRLTLLLAGRITDKILFWMLLAYALHFFPRTLLTIGFTAPQGGHEGFANSLFWQTLHLSMTVLGSGVGLAVLAAVVAEMIEDLRSERDTDHLTGILNRRGFEAAVSLALRDRAPTMASLIVCDVDHFKSINDRYGHTVGDGVLQEFGAVLRRTARKDDIIGRIGGEEFAVYLRNATLPEAYECAERLRRAIAQTVFSALNRQQVTASFGVATVRRSTGWEELYAVADGRLYRAKQSGRNRTMAEDGLDEMWSSTAKSESEVKIAHYGEKADAIIRVRRVDR